MNTVREVKLILFICRPGENAEPPLPECGEVSVLALPSLEKELLPGLGVVGDDLALGLASLGTHESFSIITATSRVEEFTSVIVCFMAHIFRVARFFGVDCRA